MRSSPSAKCFGRSRSDSSKEMRRVGTMRCGSLVWFTKATLDQMSNSLNPSYLLHWSRMATEPPPTKGEQTRQAILAAAVERFGRDGYRSTSVADIARDAGVGGTVAYAYFPSKEALFLAAVDEDAASLIGEGLALLDSDPTPLAWRRNLAITLYQAMEHHPLTRRLMAGLEPDVSARVMEIPALAELRK